jgi:hypothetical protein
LSSSNTHHLRLPGVIHARTCAVLVCLALLASCSSQPRHVEAKPEPVGPSVPTNPNGITIAAVGDVMMGTDYPENILPDDDGVGFLSSVAPVLSSADIAFGNLEEVLMDGGDAVKRCKKRKADSEQPAVTPPTPATVPTPAPPKDESPPPQTGAAVSPDSQNNGDVNTVPVEDGDAPTAETRSVPDNTSSAFTAPTTPATPSAPVVTAEQPATSGSCYVFRSPTRYATYLRDAGFDVMSLANNHAQDFGDPGRDSSMRALDDVGIRHSGRDGDVAEWTTRGRKFALVAFAPNVGSHQLNDLARAKEIVTQLAAHHDIVLVSFHGGSEGEGASKLPFAHEIYQGEDRGNVVEFAHTVIDAGADLVLGSGPHVLRAVELYRDRLIAYSLGNFATYYGISVNGIRGIAGVLTARLADDGRFLDAQLDATVQIRPAGPTLDPDRRGVTQLRDLTSEAFPAGLLTIEDTGHILRKQDSPH